MVKLNLCHLFLKGKTEAKKMQNSSRVFSFSSNWFRRYYSVFDISKTRAMNLDKFYFRYTEEEQKVDITFLYQVKDSVRQFNFSRTPTETLQTLLARIGTNIQKATDKSKKKKTNETKTSIDIKVYDGYNELVSENCSCKELFTLYRPLKLRINNNVYEAMFNAPWVTSINLPQCILAGFPVYPEYFKTQYADIKICIFNWYRGLAVNDKGNVISDIHINWELIGSNFTYTPTTQDIGMKLKLECIPANNTLVGPAVETISKNVIEAGPGKCPFETRHVFTSSTLSNTSFRCVSYNILADLYCDSDYTRAVLHPYCPPYALHIDYRKQLIIKELLGYNADIICLQEVDTKIFNHCLEPLLKSKGMQGLFYKKGKEVAEGLACFYREDRFQILGEDRILLAEALKTKTCLSTIWNKIKDNIPLIERLLNRSTIASATFLQSINNPAEVLIVGNTHLYFHPDADHIRLIQGGIFIYWLMDVRKKIVEQFSGKRVSVILCGDYNSVPSCGIYQLYTTGVAPSTLPDWKSNLAEAVENLSLEQNISLASACGTPPFTNFTAEFADCLDYIFYEKTHLEVEQVIPFPSTEELKANIALPSIVFPSDHISLISDLRFT